jgi:Uma2 family endonuclease
MPPNAVAQLHMTAAEYLEWEARQTEKHEYHCGEVFAMAGGSPRHNLLSMAAGAELRAVLRGTECRVLSSDQRIAASEGTRYVYPDAVVVCGSLRFEAGASDVLANPAVVVEVLSPRTESCDRGDKWEAYQRLPSLSDYLLISQTSVRVEHFERQDAGVWRYRVVEAGGTLTLSNGAVLTVDDIYRGAFELEAG